MKLVDTHAHLHFPRCQGDIEEVVERFKEEGGVFVLNVGVNLKDSEAALKEAKRFSFKAAAGIHPHDSKDAPEDFIQRLQRLLEDPDFVAVGEIGLDYYRNLSPKEVQKRVFQEQIDLAAALNKPLVVHIRDAYEDAYEILSSSELPDPPGIIHAFSADSEWALKFVKLGFLLGIGGPVTYPKNERLRQAVRAVGIENIVTETDCPYLPPQKRRGKRNEPSYIKFILEEISRILEMEIEEAAERIHKNAMEVLS